QLTPARIMQVGTGFWASKTLLSAVELGLFTQLSPSPQPADRLSASLGLHGRGSLDFFDALVALGFLERTGDLYRNTPETENFLVRGKPSYIGGILEMANARLYGFWGSLTEALRTGRPQNEAKHAVDVFAELYGDPARLRGFLEAMTGISQGSAHVLAEKFPWARYRTVVDVGAAQGAVLVILAQAHAHLRGIGFDLAAVQPIFEQYVHANHVQDRVGFHTGDFFKDPLPPADVIVMGHILHDWGLDTKKMLVRKAYEALPAGGAVIIHEAIIDDDRRQNAFGLLMSLNMLIETPDGFDFTAQQCSDWLREAGFSETRVEPLAGPDSMVVGIK
ncbi:MAG TPA: methyltransferase, partial [Candidatus Xenobia bacterium]